MPVVKRNSEHVGKRGTHPTHFFSGNARTLFFVFSWFSLLLLTIFFKVQIVGVIAHFFLDAEFKKISARFPNINSLLNN